MDEVRLREIMREETASGLEEIGTTATCSASQAVVWQNGRLLFENAVGATSFGPAGEGVSGETPFDIASITKPLVTGTLLLQAIGEERCHWHDPVDDYLGDWSRDEDSKSVTILQLANHTSGLPDWKPLYDSLPLSPESGQLTDNRRRMLGRIRRTQFEYSPGSDEIYSDLGYIVLGGLIERIFGEPLGRLAERRIFEPLGMDNTQFVSAADDEAPVDHAAATEDDEMRGGLVDGTVHDRNAAAFGGVAGHAGVFSTARDLAKFVGHLIAIDRRDATDEPLVDAGLLSFAWSDRSRGGHGHHLAGWDTPSGEESSAGRGFRSGATVGHLGFTGTSIWIERKRGLAAVLLTNRVYPDRDNERIKDYRIRFHEEVVPPT